MTRRASAPVAVVPTPPMANIKRGSGPPTEEYYRELGQVQRKLRLWKEDSELLDKIQAKTSEGLGEIVARLLRAEWKRLTRK